MSLKFFCESCEEPICQDCHRIGPHNNKLHRITNVIETFRKKINYITQIVNNNLAEKLDMLLNHIQSVENNMDEVKKTKGEIEREVRVEYSRIIENLRSEEGKKMAILQHESSALQKEIDKINDIVETVKEIALNENPDMIAFLLRFKALFENIEVALSKPIRSKIFLKRF
jgi:palmitoyltransferase